MDVEQEGVSGISGEVARRDGSIRFAVECSVRVIHQLETAAGSPGTGRAVAQLGPLTGLCIPTVLSDQELSIESREGRGDVSVSCPVLAEPTLVPSSAGSSLRKTVPFPSGSKPAGFKSGESPSVVPERLAHADRMEVIREGFRQKGLSGEVVKVLMASSRGSTNASYQSAWNTWSAWCKGRGDDPLVNSLDNVLSFLSQQLEAGKSYQSINVYRSALSATLDQVEGYRVGKHPLVKTLMRGIYNLNTPQPKYKSSWDVDQVLTHHLKTLPNGKLSLSALARKVSTIIALAIFLRVLEIASIGQVSISSSDSSLRFSLTAPRKAQKDGALHSLTIVIPEPIIDPVSCVKRYISVTDAFRNKTNSNRLFIGSVKPHRPVTGSTIAGWIKRQLTQPESTRLSSLLIPQEASPPPKQPRQEPRLLQS